MALGMAESIARFKANDERLNGLDDFKGAQGAMIAQGEIYQQVLGAFGERISSLDEDEPKQPAIQSLEARLADHEARLRKLEDGQPPAA